MDRIGAWAVQLPELAPSRGVHGEPCDPSASVPSLFSAVSSRSGAPSTSRARPRPGRAGAREACTGRLDRPARQPDLPGPQAAPRLSRTETGAWHHDTDEAGDPAPAALAESRLQATTCEQAAADDIEPLLREMREAVNESQKEWVAGNPPAGSRCARTTASGSSGEKSGLRPVRLRRPSASAAGEGGGGRGEGASGSGASARSVTGAGVAAAPAMRPQIRAARAATCGLRAARTRRRETEPAGGEEVWHEQPGRDRRRSRHREDGRQVGLCRRERCACIMEAPEPHVVSTTKLPARCAMFVGEIAPSSTRRAATPARSARTPTTASSRATALSTKVQVLQPRRPRASGAPPRSTSPAPSSPRADRQRDPHRRLRRRRAGAVLRDVARGPSRRAGRPTRSPRRSSRS